MPRDLLSDSDSESSEDQVGGARIDEDLKVNEEYAKRFEHNKKREELQRLEEKHGNSSRKRKRGNENGNLAVSESESSSSSEDEDEEAEFATEALDSEILATLNAIKSKDPRVYDSSAVFYTGFDENAVPSRQREDKPMFLRDYHRDNLLNGGGPESEEPPLSYNQQQEQLKKSILSEMHAAAAASDDSDSESDGGLLVRKQQSRPLPTKPSEKLDVENAERDPETFLSNFMASRAWLPTDKTELHPFESDDEEDEKRAEEYEEAYNMRFEDPEKSNEKLRSHARDVAAQYSVRREEANPRKKKRESEKQAKEAAKQELREEKSRLKKLRMDEVAAKVNRIKHAAGLKASDLKPEDWSHFIDDDWDDTKWEAEMQKRFGDEYYAEDEGLVQQEQAGDDTEEASLKPRKRKAKKPKFDDDIDIKDIIPDFQSEDDADQFELTDNDDETPENANEHKDTFHQRTTTTTKKSLKQQKREKQKDSKMQRRIIEQLVDDQLQLELQHALPASSLSKSSGFRYRETSPQSFGLTARDILLAEDSALNEFAGLKKLASWRPEDKKRKDQKRLGKKARLRKWRADTFGNEEGPTVELLDQLAVADASAGAGAGASGDDDIDDARTPALSGARKQRERKDADLVGVSDDEEDGELGGVNIREKDEMGGIEKKRNRRGGRKGKKPRIEA